jgi:hypothetical protein
VSTDAVTDKAFSRGTATKYDGLTPRQAGLVVAFTMLIGTPFAPFAEFGVFHKLILPGDIGQTATNILGHNKLFLTGIFFLIVNYVLDVVIAWGLYFLFAPVNRSLSLLAAWFRLVFTAIGLFSVLHLVTAFRLLNEPAYLTAFGPDQLHAQLMLLLSSFRSDWSIGLLIFALHLILVGYLIYRSGYIPKIIGILLVINGLAWIVGSLHPYFFPSMHLDFLFVAYFGELILMLWLLARGWVLPESFGRRNAA